MHDARMKSERRIVETEALLVTTVRRTLEDVPTTVLSDLPSECGQPERNEFGGVQLQSKRRRQVRSAIRVLAVEHWWRAVRLLLTRRSLDLFEALDLSWRTRLTTGYACNTTRVGEILKELEARIVGDVSLRSTTTHRVVVNIKHADIQLPTFG